MASYAYRPILARHFYFWNTIALALLMKTYVTCFGIEAAVSLAIQWSTSAAEEAAESVSASAAVNTSVDMVCFVEAAEVEVQSSWWRFDREIIIILQSMYFERQ